MSERSYADWEQKKAPLVGVEPVMFLYMSAFMITSVVEEAFFVYKACYVNLGFPKDICDFINEKQYQNYSTVVQVEVSKFHQYENLASHAVPVLLAFFIGAWSDRVGRKIPLLFGLAGSLLYSLMIIVNTLNDTWPVETILYTASFPCAITGASLTIFMSAFSYLSDTTPQEQRTLRITLLEVAYLTPMPLGVALGSYLFNGPLARSYPLMFTVNAALLTGALFYTALVLPRRTAPPALQDTTTCCSRFQVTDSFKALLRPRTERRRTLILLSLLAMALYTLQRDEKRMVQLYTIWRFNWSVKDFSNFRTFQSSFFILGLLLCVPLLQKYLKLRDTFIMMIGAASHFATRVIFIAANSPHWFYVGAVAATLGPVVAPVLRSILSKTIPASERGKVFALFSVADTTVPLLSGFVYSQTYIHTIQGPFPQAIFLVTALSQIMVFFIAIFMNHVLGGKKLTQAKEEGEDEVEDLSCN